MEVGTRYTTSAVRDILRATRRRSLGGDNRGATSILASATVKGKEAEAPLQSI